MRQWWFDDGSTKKNKCTSSWKLWSHLVPIIHNHHGKDLVYQELVADLVL